MVLYCVKHQGSDLHQHQHESLTQKMRLSKSSETTAVYYPVLATVGAPVNIVTIAILSFKDCGLSKCITRYLVAMAAADLMVIVWNVILHRVATIYWDYTFLLYTPVCRFILFMSPAAIDISVWLTVSFTFDRLVAICYQKLKTKYCTEKTAVVVITTVSSLLCLKNIPWPFLYSSYYNWRPWGCMLSTYFFIEPIMIAYSWIEQLLTPVIPFFLILFFNIVTVRRIVIASRGRTSLRQHSSDRDENDPELINRRRSIVLLFAISSSFILLWMTTVIYFICVRITSAFKSRYILTPFPEFQEAGIMLQLLSSCTNTAIYTITQRKFRNMLLSAFKYPFTLIGKLVKCGRKHY
ncbi:probable G-protein coupled receptor 139 [Scyliorhinus canicula]|uniref:probable G-protein coupled receptor 139 n=1 Tax=Scyliorhinus canicula TaxID=7830 RepID=UPI0018F38E6E|nr:probable G-protein coupled receptor 139 [Scyliorhinus canicula]